MINKIELNDDQYYSLNQEAIDMLYDRGILDEEHISAAIKLRKLRYLKYGKAHLTSRNYDEIIYDNNFLVNYSDENQEDENLYNEAIELLSKERITQDILNLCVYNEAPRSNMYQKIRSGLEKLSKLFDQYYFL